MHVCWFRKPYEKYQLAQGSTMMEVIVRVNGCHQNEKTNDEKRIASGYIDWALGIGDQALDHPL
jgi:hypothetical protein